MTTGNGEWEEQSSPRKSTNRLSNTLISPEDIDLRNTIEIILGIYTCNNNNEKRAPEFEREMMGIWKGLEKGKGKVKQL